MPRLHPHLHMFLPSSDPSIALEARLYLPLVSESGPKLPLTDSPASYTNPPRHYDQLGVEAKDSIRDMNIKRIIIAAHPWGRMGGNMLDPILMRLVSAVYDPSEADDTTLAPTALGEPPKTAILTYNVRGVGCSQGSQPWLGVGSDPLDLAHIESLVLEMLGTVTEVCRFGYSWGSLLVILAPTGRLLRRILLVSPPCGIFGGITYFARRSFRKAASDLLISGVDVRMIYGTKDEFTSVKTFQGFGKAITDEVVNPRKDKVTGKFDSLAIEEADHMYRRDYGEILVEEIGKWLGWTVQPY